MNFFKEYIFAGNTEISNLILENINKIGMTSDEFLIYTAIVNQQRSNEFIDFNTISFQTGISLEQVFTVVNSMLTKKFIKLTRIKNNQNKLGDFYDTSQIFNLIANKLSVEADNKFNNVSENNIGQLIKEIEVEFGRVLSPLEIQTIYGWINDEKYDLGIVRLALREAVLKQVNNLKYIDKILLDWQKNNLSSVEQVKSYMTRYKF